MKTFKILFSFSCVIVAFVLAMIIQNANPQRTVDFRGEVISMAKGEETTTILACSVAGGEFRFRIDERSILENCCGERIGVENLSDGTLIQITYRKPIFRTEEIHTVKRLVAFD